MKDNLSIIITMLVFVILIVIFPLYNYFERQDDMSYNLVLKSTTNFVDEVINCGYIDQEMYDNFIQKLSVTGNLYDIQLEAHKKTYTKDPYNLTADTFIEQYNIDYNADIFDVDSGKTQSSNVKIDNKVLKNGGYYLNVGDQIYVKVKNSSTTMAGAIFSMIVPTSKKERVTVNYGGIIKNNAWEKQDISNIFQKDIYIDMRLDVASTPGVAEKINDKPTFSIEDSTQIKFIVKVVNYAQSVEGSISDLLKNNLKITGFENKKFINPKTVTKVASKPEWIATFDLTTITNVSDYFGSEFYKTCQLELEPDIIQGNYYKNEAVKSDSITIKSSSALHLAPNIEGPYINGSPSVVSQVELGNSVIYYVNYYESTVTATAADFKDYVTAEGFTYDNLIVNKDSSGKRFKLTFENISGVPNTVFKIKTNPDWAEYIDVAANARKKVGILNSIGATFKFTAKQYSEPGIYKFTVPIDGRYKLTVIGANGGGNSDTAVSAGSRGGKGGKSAGTIRLTKGNTLYIVVGGVGKAAIAGASSTGGYNGGGNGSRYPTSHESFSNSYGYGGGGATDIRLSSTAITSPNMLLNTRIIVAGGGGGADDGGGTPEHAGVIGGHNDGSGGHGGGGNNAGGYGFINGSISGGAEPGTTQGGYSLGIGQNATSQIDSGGGGGGYYGGYASSISSNNSGGAGGSGYISAGFTDIVESNGANSNIDGNGRATIEFIGT